MKKRKTFFARSLATLLLLVGACAVSAETRIDRAEMKHELRVGWGDQLFETAIWHNPTDTIIMPVNPYVDYSQKSYTYKENYRYYQHLWLEYQYRFNYWFSLGGMIDDSGFVWDNVTRDGFGKEIGREVNQYAYNVVVMPTIRFTYLYHPFVNLYSGLGFGMVVNGGTERNAYGKTIDAGAAINFTILGLSANYKRFFASVEYGGMYGLKDQNTVFMLKSRMFAAAIGVRF